MTDTPQHELHAVTMTTGLGALTVGGLDDEARATVLQEWSRCSPHPATADATADLIRGDEGWRQFHENLVYRATSRAIDSGRGSHLLFHGACLADPQTGAAIVLAAASGTGKTTATRVLGRHWSYLTDETVIVDPKDGAVTPFAKPLSLLGADGKRPKRQAGPDGLGLGATREARVRCFAVLDRVRDASEPVTARAEPMALVDALAALVPQTSSLASLDRGLVALCQVLDRTGGVRRLVYSEAADLQPVLAGLLAEEPTPLRPEWAPLDDEELAASAAGPDATADSTEPSAPAARRLRRPAAACGIALPDERIVLLVQQRLLVLDGIGPALWSLLDRDRSVEEILESLEAGGSFPANAREVVDTSLEALRSEGLVLDA